MGMIALVIALMIGVAIGYVATVLRFALGKWGLGPLKVVGKAATGSIDLEDVERIVAVYNFVGSNREITPRIRVALQALVDRMEEPVARVSANEGGAPVSAGDES